MNYLIGSNYISNKTQLAIVEGKISDSVAVTSEVSQGTVLGTLFFLLYINNLPDSIKCKIGLFADDSIVYNNIISITDCKMLQSDLDVFRCLTIDSNSLKCVVQKACS